MCYQKHPQISGKHTEFPGSRDGLVFLWHGSLEGSNEIEPRDDASIAEDGQMDLTGGSFLAKNISGALLAACKESNQLTLECLVTIDNLNQSGSGAYHFVFKRCYTSQLHLWSGWQPFCDANSHTAYR